MFPVDHIFVEWYIFKIKLFLINSIVFIILTIFFFNNIISGFTILAACGICYQEALQAWY
jgi:hypothetical protein